MDSAKLREEEDDCGFSRLFKAVEDDCRGQPLTTNRYRRRPSEKTTSKDYRSYQEKREEGDDRRDEEKRERDTEDDRRDEEKRERGKI